MAPLSWEWGAKTHRILTCSQARPRHTRQGRLRPLPPPSSTVPYYCASQARHSRAHRQGAPQALEVELQHTEGRHGAWLAAQGSAQVCLGLKDGGQGQAGELGQRHLVAEQLGLLAGCTEEGGWDGRRGKVSCRGFSFCFSFALCVGVVLPIANTGPATPELAVGCATCRGYTKCRGRRPQLSTHSCARTAAAWRQRRAAPGRPPWPPQRTAPSRRAAPRPRQSPPASAADSRRGIDEGREGRRGRRGPI